MLLELRREGLNDTGQFSVAVPPRTVRKGLLAHGNSKNAAPFDHAVEIGAAEIELDRGTIVRGTYRKLDGSPFVKTSVTLYPILPNGDLAKSERHRTATTDQAGRFEFAPAASGPHVLIPYQGIPERLNLKPGKAIEVDADAAPFYDVQFDFENTMGHFSGNFNFRLQGDIDVKGGDPIERSAFTFKDADKVTFRVPQSMKNAKLHFTNFPTQSVHIVEESGNVILPSEDSKPIDIPDLLNPPKLKICMGKAAQFYVNIVEADGALAKDIEVTCSATGDHGKRELGSLRRWGDVWVSGGLFEGERVTVTVRRGDWSVTSKPSKAVKVEANDPTNKIELKLPPMTVTEDKPQDGVFFGYTGYMTYVIELREGRFRYWFESDAKMPEEPEYPLEGKYTVKDDTVTLHHEKLIPLSSIWKCRSVNGIPTLWRSDALEPHGEKPMQLSVEALRKWGSGSILAFTTKPGEFMWENRTAPTFVEPATTENESIEIENDEPQQSSLKITEPGQYDLADVSILVRKSKDADGLVRNEMVVSHGQGEQTVEDTCALAFGDESWALLAKTVEDKPGCLRISVADQWGVQTYEFEPDSRRARFSKPGFDLEARWSMPAKRFLDGHRARFADPDVVAWAQLVLPELKPESAEANTPILEVRLISAENEKPEMVRPTIARKNVNPRRLGKFIPLGEQILEQDDLQEIGVSIGGVVRLLYGIRSEEAAKRFEAFRTKHAGRRVAFIKNGQVVNQADLNEDFSSENFLSSRF